MSGFLYAFLAVLVAGIGARDGALVAHVVRVQGPRLPLLAVALLSAFAATALACLAAIRLLTEVAPTDRWIFAALGLLLAGGEMLLWPSPRPPAEPTRSLFAAGPVLLAQQLTDAARFLVLSLGIATAAPIPAAIGGAAASAAMIGFGWAAGDLATGPRLRMVRRSGGIALLLMGLGQFIA